METTMATAAPEPTLDIREQIARIDKMQAEIAKTQADLAKTKLEVRFFPGTLLFQATVAAAALMTAGAAIAKFFG
ncbi:hypothetical protein [Sphingomonas corticis]|uniref:DUF3618 domain-containing protein n=1 Tax=Sphingomonas corticis TaxID=2722791 RepID=A0ABX1CX13_9SPHN|nr:hypothetical protein [Sphingomonas corticis]NJR80510.1 hypothetical protein [Sphingomonas corticis]